MKPDQIRVNILKDGTIQYRDRAILAFKSSERRRISQALRNDAGSEVVISTSPHRQWVGRNGRSGGQFVARFFTIPSFLLWRGAPRWKRVGISSFAIWFVLLRIQLQSTTGSPPGLLLLIVANKRRDLLWMLFRAATLIAERGFCTPARGDPRSKGSDETPVALWREDVFGEGSRQFRYYSSSSLSPKNR